MLRMFGALAEESWKRALAVAYVSAWVASCASQSLTERPDSATTDSGRGETNGDDAGRGAGDAGSDSAGNSMTDVRRTDGQGSTDAARDVSNSDGSGGAGGTTGRDGAPPDVRIDINSGGSAGSGG